MNNTAQKEIIITPFNSLTIQHNNRMTGIILQARMGSSRLPGKVLTKMGDKNLLEHIFHRLSFLKHEIKLVVATTILKKDDVIVEFCLSKGIECFRGSEDNVLERYYLCAQKYNFNNIVRLTGDNLCTDIEELDNLITLHIDSKANYSHSFGSLPIGVGAEIFTFDALEKSYYSGTKENHKEHVNEYIQEHPELFNISVLSVPEYKKMPELRLTVDTNEDYQRACFIIENSADRYISTERAIELCTHFV